MEWNKEKIQLFIVIAIWYSRITTTTTTTTTTKLRENNINNKQYLI